MRTLKTEAVVLKKRNLLGKDISATLFTQTKGKVSVIVKGVKKITSRRAPHIQTGNLLNIILNGANNRFYMQESKLVSAFSGIKDHQEKLEVQYLYFFILDRILPDMEPEGKLYMTTKSFMVRLANQKEFTKHEIFEELSKILTILGYDKGSKTLTDLLRYIEEIIHEKIPSGII